ncbi:MAG: phosphate-starvation-inducible PsiE family protein [Chloroflexota bacterium]|nr:phosphate-starvation-inducible PsiE family protein [Chloroflexota bacterium]
MTTSDGSARPQFADELPRRPSLRRIIGFTHVLESTDSIVYALVGASFLLAAVCSLVYSIAKFALTLWNEGGASGDSLLTSANTGTALINFVSDLLLTLIILEVLSTVVHYLRTRATSLKPFLFIGIISATRGVLAVGARLSVADFALLASGSGAAEFRNSMIELGVNAGVIIALGLALRLIGHFLDDEPTRAQS